MIRNAGPITRRAAALALLACAALVAPAGAQTLPVVRVALIPAEACAQVYIAQQMGFFQKAGIAVDIAVIPNTSAIAEAVASNATDVGFSAILSIATAYKKGLPFTMVAPGNVYDSAAPVAAIVVGQSSPIRTAKDLNGKTIGANAIKSISEYGPRAWIDKNGGDSSTVKFLELTFAAMPEALAAGRIDAEWLTEPYVAIGKKTGRVLGYAFDAIGPSFLISGWFANKQWVKDHPDLVGRFASAIRDASRWANANQAESGKIVQTVTKIEPAVFAGVVRTKFAERLTASDVQPQVDLAARYGLFPQTFSAADLIYVPAEMNALSRSQLLALTAAAAVAYPARVAAQAEPVKLRIGSSRTDTFGAGFYAADGGFFKSAGIDVEVLTFSNGAAVAAACAGGSLDIGVGEVTELANGVARGLPFALIAGGGLFATDAPTTMLCVGKDSPLRRARDLEGKTIAVPVLVSLSAIAVKLWLVKNGVDVNKVHFTEISTAAMPAALEHGTVDAAHIGEPGLTIGGPALRPIAAPYSAIARQFLISDWFTTRDWIAKNPEVAKRVVTVAYQTARWANAHQDLTAPIIAKYAGLDADRARAMRRTRFATALDAGLVQPVLDAAAQFGGLPRPMKADELIAKI